MIKGKTIILFVFSGVVVLLVAAIFTFSKGMRENFMVTANLLLPRHGASTVEPLPNRDNEAGLRPPNTNSEQESTSTTTNTPPQRNDNMPINISIYRNDEFGFEFVIPEGWQAKENLFHSPYSYFNITLVPLRQKAVYPDPILVNIVKPEFVDMSYSTMRPTDTAIVVDGIKGVKYQYTFEGGDNTDIILPRSQKTVIIGSWNQYKDTFNEVVSSFKFIR